MHVLAHAQLHNEAGDGEAAGWPKLARIRQIPPEIRSVSVSGPSGLECGRRRLAVVPKRGFASGSWPVCERVGLSTARFKAEITGTVLSRRLWACLSACMAAYTHAWMHA